MSSPVATKTALSDAQRFELLVTSVRDYAIYMLDPGGYIASWNSGAQRFKGYAAAEIIGQHFSLFYTEQDRTAGVPETALRTAVEQGKFEAEGWRVRKDGTRFWASVVIDPIRNDAGELLGFAKITRDITDRMLASEALRKSEEQFRILVQGVTDYAIYMLSPAGEVVSWNAGAARIKGYQEAEIIGRHFSCFYTAEDCAAGAPDSVLATAASKGRVEREGWRLRKDGTRFWAHVIVDAIHGEDGLLVGFAKVTRDMTERKEAAAAIERANLALFQSQKMEAIGQLTGGIAHDFNNLLAVVSNGLQVLATQSRTHLDVKMIQSMQRAVDRGASLTQQLLSFARQQPLKAERHDLNVLIRDFEPMVRRAGREGVSIEVRTAAEPALTWIDAPRFEAALLNLVVNARDALPGGGRIVVSTQIVELQAGAVGALPEASYVRVSVADNGEGMPGEVVARAFEPFFTTKEPGKGTGLGLSQVYGFITQSGGDVVITSVVDEGTSVDLYLPQIFGQAHERAEHSRQLAVETVLLVEDEADVLSGAAELFRSIGYEVVTATNAAEATEVLRARTDIDIIFSDVVMPQGRSGIELARLAKSTYPHVKVVLTSAYPLAALRRKHGEIGEFVFVHKPYRLSDVAKAMRTSS